MHESTLASSSVVRISQNRGRHAGIAALAAIVTTLGSLGAALTGERAFDDFPVESIPIAAVLAVVFTAIYAARRGDPTAGVLRHGTPGTLRAVGDFVHVETMEAQWSLPRADVEGGFVEVHAVAPQLVLQLRSGDLVVAAANDTSSAEAFLDALAPSRRALVLELGSIADPRRRAWLGAALLLLLPLCVPFLVLLALVGYAPSIDAIGLFAITTPLSSLPLFGIAGVVRALARTRVRVGADGIFVRWLVRRRFVPHRAIDSVVSDGSLVFLDGPDPVRLRVATPVEGRLVAERLERLRARAVLRAPELSPLARAGRTLADWRNALRALADEGYRAACAPEDLARIVEDPASTPELRVAAAVALTSWNGPEPARIRLAIDAAAEPELRFALERAEAGELDERALERATAVHTRTTCVRSQQLAR